MSSHILVRAFFSCVAMLVAASAIQGCQSEPEPDVEVDPVSKISAYDRVRLTLVDADSVGIHLFDLKKLREDLILLKQTDPDLADLLLADLDRVEAVPKAQVRDRIAIGKEMYARLKASSQ